LPASTNFTSDRSFDSLRDCMKYIAHRFTGMHRVLSRTEGGLIIPDFWPTYLFRGECGRRYPTTLPASYRPSTYQFRGRCLQADDLANLGRLTAALLRRFVESDYGLDELSACGLLQHYGLPTPMLDFTANSGHAATFAVSGEDSIGRICVLPTLRLGSRVVNWTAHGWAERAYRQLGFGVLLPGVDLKSDAVRETLAISWYEFPISDPDREYWQPKYQDLVRLNDDPSAGFIRHHITEYVETFGKLSPLLAEWLIERVPMVPRCYLVKGFDGSEVKVRHRPPSALGVDDFSAEAEWSHRYWSNLYPDSSYSRVADWYWPAPGTIVADPRTYHAAA
jgi:hypothetical protein